MQVQSFLYQTRLLVHQSARVATGIDTAATDANRKNLSDFRDMLTPCSHMPVSPVIAVMALVYSQLGRDLT